jgi:zinc/manganese transport system substrate-binding protein
MFFCMTFIKTRESGLRSVRASRTLVVAAGAMAIALLAAACASAAGSAQTASTKVINVIGAENEYASVLGQVGGRYVHVSSILSNPNTDPHTFEASPQVAQEVAAAQVIVQNGLGYDSWIDKMESASPQSGRKVVVVQHVLGLPDSTANPHLWYRPETMPAVARVIAADLSAIQPAHAAYFRARLNAFNRSLQPWLHAIAQFKARYPGATAANTEPVADYLLTAMGINNLTPFRFQADIMNGVEPAPQDIALENGLFSHHKVKVFLYNEQVTDALTASIRQHATQAGVPVVAVYETMPTPGYTYQSWMLAETRAITQAVAAGASTRKL